MQIYFGRDCQEVPTSIQQQSKFVAESSPFVYSYGIDFGSRATEFRDIIIYDAFDREVPIDVGAIPDLIKALKQVLNLADAANQVKNLCFDVSNSEIVTAV